MTVVTSFKTFPNPTVTYPADLAETCVKRFGHSYLPCGITEGYLPHRVKAFDLLRKYLTVCVPSVDRISDQDTINAICRLPDLERLPCNLKLNQNLSVLEVRNLISWATDNNQENLISANFSRNYLTLKLSFPDFVRLCRDQDVEKISMGRHEPRFKVYNFEHATVISAYSEWDSLSLELIKLSLVQLNGHDGKHYLLKSSEPRLSRETTCRHYCMPLSTEPIDDWNFECFGRVDHTNFHEFDETASPGWSKLHSIIRDNLLLSVIK